MRRAKIVCTLGPATAGVERLSEMIAAGMDVARLNFSHGDYAAQRALYDDLRKAQAIARKPIAVIVDLCGPKIRIGRVANGAIELLAGQRVCLTPADELGTAARLPHSYPLLARDAKVGEAVLIDDGLVRLRITATDLDSGEVTAIVEIGGVVGDHKGMNLPQSALSVPALTEKDKADIAFARELGADYLALSFVRKASDILEAKALAGDIPLIAKIEKPEAVTNMEAILDVADAVMVARGDLGVELGHEKVPLVQKRLIAAIRPRAKPVITATQMLDSMIRNPTPTRAEVSDVANAILDGTDAVMLSGETSVGKYPVQAVAVMASIIDEIEGEGQALCVHGSAALRECSFSGAIAQAVTIAAKEFGLKAIAVYTESGRSAALVSAERPRASLVAFSQHAHVLQRLALYWGVNPLHGEWVRDLKSIVELAERKLLAQELVQRGDTIAITFGIPLGDEAFQTNMLKLWRVGSEKRTP